MVFFCSGYKQIQRFFPILFNSKNDQATSKGTIKRKDIKTLLENNYWEVVRNKIAEDGVFNTINLNPLDSVDNSNLLEVLQFFNLKVASLTEE